MDDQAVDDAVNDYFDTYDPLLEKGKQLTIVPRDEWSDIPPKSTDSILSHPVNNMFITATGTESCYDREECIPILKELQAKHMAEGLEDIGFNFLISGDATVFEGRGWKYKAQIVNLTKEERKFAGESIEVAYIGQLEGDHRPTVRAIKVPKMIAAMGRDLGYVDVLYNKIEPRTKDLIYGNSSD